MRKVGILGGAFDPPHYGHLILAQEAFEQFELDRVEFLPSLRPHQKTSESFERRCVMTALAVANDHRFQVNGSEQVLKSSYTVDVLDHLVKKHPDNEYTLIIGGDQAGKFFTWMDPLRVLDLAQIVSTERALYNRGRIQDHWGDDKDRIEFLDIPLMDISSSLVREHIKAHRSVQYLVPSLVLNFIIAEGLYQ